MTSGSDPRRRTTWLDSVTGSFAGKPSAFYDLFRVESGKIAEHSDTIEAIPPKDQWKNANGKF